jgi:triosephosphate isomerase (TIM)
MFCCKTYLFRSIFLSITADVVVAPPFVYIEQVKNSLTDHIEISAQNVWIGKGGAFTGEIRLEFLLLLLL